MAAIVDGPDDEAVGRAAHALKSSSRLLGASGLADACQAIEHEGLGDTDVAGLAAAVRSDLETWSADREQG